MLSLALRDDQKAKNKAVFSYQFGYQLAHGTVQKLSNFSPVHSVRDRGIGCPVVCSQNRIRSKLAWGHGDLPQKPRFSWSERYVGNQSRTGRRPGPQTQDHLIAF